MKTVRFQSSYNEPYPLQIVGEQSYRTKIEEVTNYMGEEEGVNADDFIAHLILEDDNPYDRGNAVRVDIDGRTVGYLSTPAAKKYRKKLVELGLSDIIGECYASIKGGFIKQNTGEQADFGVRLDLIIDEMKVYIPPAPKPVEIQPQTPIVEPTIQIAEPEPTAIRKLIKKALSPEHFKTTLVLILLLVLMVSSIMNQIMSQFLR